MGRTALLVVMAMAMVFGILGINLRSSSTGLVDAHAGYYKYTNARNIARTAIHRYLRYLDGIPGYTGGPPISGSLDDGSFELDALTVADTLWLKSTGQYADSAYVMQTKLLFTPKPFPKVEGAVTICATPAVVKFSGNSAVDGNNYNAAGTALVGSGNMPGVTLINPSDSSGVATSGAGHITGSPDVAVKSSLMDPVTFMDEYEQSAHYTFNTPGNVSGSWIFGSAANPAIVVCNAGTDTNFSIRFTGSITGWGILAVNGNIKFSGGINWHGLIIAYGQNNIVDFEATGNPQLVGGVIVAGNSGASLIFKGTGTGGKVKYSSEALDKARHIGRLLYYSVIEWYE